MMKVNTGLTSVQVYHILQMEEIRAFWRVYNFELRVACVRKEYQSENNSETLFQLKQQEKNQEIDAEDIGIYPYHHAITDQDTIPLTEKMNLKNYHDQEVIQDLENTRVQEKLEQMLIGIIIDLKPETNQEVEAEECIEEGSIIINCSQSTYILIFNFHCT
ncbi:MAG: hypothetical protein EZS28_013230 [Streblomastix strix]|uniref:Uncharacterized protein n=1 Tax=Streblomastix strix TaxID=222440 RepID=A0A5J4W8I3_9EUKA|nr:MAG: hypothetical protein EZS28_013230 [Streblomastix strix]